MRKLSILFLMVGTLVMTSCGDDNGPEVTISTPSNGFGVAAGGTLVVTGTATDDMEVSSISVSGKDGFSLSGSLDLSGVTDRTSIAFTFDVNIDANSTPGDYTLVVTATDNDGNTDDAELEFSVQ